TRTLLLTPPTTTPPPFPYTTLFRSVRVAVVARPTDHVQIAGVARVDLRDVVRSPWRAVRDDVEARLLEARRERLEVALRVGHVGPRDAGRVPEVERDGQLEAGRRQKRFGLVRVVGILRDLVRPAEERRRLELDRELCPSCVERIDDALAVEAVRDRLADLEIVRRR